MRKLKPYLIETVRNNTSGLEAQIYFDRNRDKFTSNVYGETVQAMDAPECRRLVEMALIRAEKYDWQKIIVINARNSIPVMNMPRNTELVIMGYEILTVSEKPGEKGAYVRKDIDSEGCEYQRTYNGPTLERPRTQYDEFALPYSEAAIAALDDILLKMRTLKVNLKSLLSNAQSKLSFPAQILLTE